METRIVLAETWLSRRPRKGALDLTFALLALCVLATFVYLNGSGGLERYLAASGEAVFVRHEYWRAWTTLFVHADLGHLLANAFLFVPLSYFLAGYYPRWFFPGLAFLLGGAANFVVLATMPPEATLVGVSGVLYWMGAAWLTLYLKIEKRDPPRRRLGKVIIVSAALFLPDSVQPHVSYLSHYLGFLAGIASGLGLYAFRRRSFLSAERRQLLFIEDGIGEEWKGPGPIRQDSPAPHDPLEESP